MRYIATCNQGQLNALEDQSKYSIIVNFCHADLCVGDEWGGGGGAAEKKPE